jgi:hypothetical protein
MAHALQLSGEHLFLHIQLAHPYSVYRMAEQCFKCLLLVITHIFSTQGTVEHEADPASRYRRGRQAVSAPAYESRYPTVANYFTVELAVLKELSQELADLFGLALPVSLKKQAHQIAGDQ